MHFDAQLTLGHVSLGSSVPSLTFQLPDKPFFHASDFRTQHVVVSVHPIGSLAEEDENTFWIPYVPELNEYYGRQMCFMPRAARAEPDGLGIVCDVDRESLTLYALQKPQLIARIFAAVAVQVGK